ncbi:MAG: FHA domain-containing protein [Pseudomonadales bacterium]
MRDRIVSFSREVKRRNVLNTCMLYVLVCWGGLQVGDIVFPALGYDPDIGSRWLLFAAIGGFPVTFVLAWFYQITPHGIVRTSSFVERRVLNNLEPIDDSRQSGGNKYFNKGADVPRYNWVISAESGPLEGLSYGISRALILGRSLDCDLTVMSPHISRQHIRLDLNSDGELLVEDLGSANGTFINGEKVEGKQIIHHNDALQFHDIVFRFTETFLRSRDESATLNKTMFIDTSSTDT